MGSEEGVIGKKPVKTLVFVCVSSAILLLEGAGSDIATAQSNGLAMFAKLEKGEWTVRLRDSADGQKICVRSGEELIQLRHADENCSRFVVENEATEVTIQYTCAGNGYGRTNIRLETNSLVQVESQGIANGLPFEVVGEARRTSDC